MQSYASCLLLSLLRYCSCCSACSSCSGSSSCIAILLCQLVHCSGLLQSLLYNLDSAVHAGTVCLHCVCWDSILAFLTCDWFHLHAGIVCLASLASDWLTACWDSLSKLLHAGIAWLHLACWDRLSNFPSLWLGNCMLG